MRLIVAQLYPNPHVPMTMIVWSAPLDTSPLGLRASPRRGAGGPRLSACLCMGTSRSRARRRPRPAVLWGIRAFGAGAWTLIRSLWGGLLERRYAIPSDLGILQRFASCVPVSPTSACIWRTGTFWFDSVACSNRKNQRRSDRKRKSLSR
jgi:hypothetical protein